MSDPILTKKFEIKHFKTNSNIVSYGINIILFVLFLSIISVPGVIIYKYFVDKSDIFSHLNADNFAEILGILVMFILLLIVKSHLDVLYNMYRYIIIDNKSKMDLSIADNLKYKIVKQLNYSTNNLHTQKLFTVKSPIILDSSSDCDEIYQRIIDEIDYDSKFDRNDFGSVDNIKKSYNDMEESLLLSKSEIENLKIEISNYDKDIISLRKSVENAENKRYKQAVEDFNVIGSTAQIADLFIDTISSRDDLAQDDDSIATIVSKILSLNPRVIERVKHLQYVSLEEKRISQYDTIMRLYAQKIKDAENDDTLDDRETHIEMLRNLRDAEIQRHLQALSSE